ncbi:MAG: nickel-dependent lactate racemase [Promethearchaeota archaeon]|nr:MAG: nickel-dependent lactate racemase [Candidatus Lokiarchaeota archaeon]
MQIYEITNKKSIMNESFGVELTQQIELPYGSRKITFQLPASWNLLGQFMPHDPKVSKSPHDLLSNALNNLLGMANFSSLIQDKKNIIIISDDKSRPTPTHILIPLLLNKLNAAGIPDANIKIVVGRGLHPSLTRDELRDKFGAEVLNRVKVHDHNPTGNLTYIGETSFGTQVFVNSEVYAADFKIGLGSILPHELAGFTGGSGIVIPGVASQDTINQNHCLVGSFEAEFGKLEGNTIRDDMEEAAKLLGLDLIINTILNSENQILEIVAGDPIIAHHHGVTISKEIYGVKIPKLANVVIASSYPRDATFGKATKALFSSHLAIKNDGIIILLAPCKEGISSSQIFHDMLLQNPTSDTLFDYIRKGQLPGESCVLYLFAKVKESRIIVVSDGLNPDQVAQMGLEFAPDLETALSRITLTNPDVLILPKGAITLPLLQ